MKKRLFVVLAAMIVLAGLSANAQEKNDDPKRVDGETSIRGDVNEDGIVDVADINAIIEIMKNGGGIGGKKIYYWYVGAEQPTALPTSDSELATGIDSGWRKIGTTKPSAGTVIFDGTAQDEIVCGTSKVTLYFAINSDVTIGSYDSFGVDQTSSLLTGPTVSNGMNIYTTTYKSKSFGEIIKVK